MRRGETSRRQDPHFHLPEFRKLTEEVQAVDHEPLRVLFQQSGETSDPSDGHLGAEFPYIEISAVKLGVNEYEVSLVPSSEAPSRARMVARSGDILLSTTRPHRGAIAMLRSQDDGAIASTGFSILRALGSISQGDREFLLWVLSSRAVLGQLHQRSSGGSYPAITPDEIDQVLLPLPRNKEYRQALLADLDAARESRARKLAEAEALLAGMDQFLLDELRLTPPELQRSVFAIRAMQLDGPLNPERYRGFALEKSITGKPIETVVEILDEKTTPSSEAPDVDWDWIRIDDLDNQPLDLPGVRTALGTDIEGSFFAVRENDILVARLGPTILNRKFVLCPKLIRRTVASGEFLVLRCREGWNPTVVLWILRTSLYRDLIYSKARGATPSRYRVNREDFAKLPFPQLRPDQQTKCYAEILRRVDAIKTLRKEAAREWDAAKARFEAALLGEGAGA